jgi:hypothetical protein
MVEFTRYSEIDSHECEVKGVRRQIVDLEGERLQSFNNTVVRFERTIFYLCDKCITRTIVHSHWDYLEKLKVNNLNWLTLLKISLEIYTGEMKGFANVSDFKDAREAEMLPSMQKLLMSSLNINTSGYHIVSSADNMQISIAIEFCIRIQALKFLFTQIFDLFSGANMRSQFIRGLEPFILSGKLKQQSLPPKMIGIII